MIFHLQSVLYLSFVYLIMFLNIHIFSKSYYLRERLTFLCHYQYRKDSTGIPHILEHSVLCGSRKYPLKEPFVELLKGSLHTFLNAFTYPDRTCYPVASTNAKVKFFALVNKKVYSSLILSLELLSFSGFLQLG